MNASAIRSIGLRSKSTATAAVVAPKLATPSSATPTLLQQQLRRPAQSVAGYSTYRAPSMLNRHGLTPTSANSMIPALAHSLRCASTTTNTATKPQSTTTTTTSSSPTSPSPASASSVSALDWDRFFKLRKMRRRYSQASSALTAVATTGGGLQLLASQDIDKISAQFPILDPMVMIVLAIAASGSFGWLIGPFLGNGLFHLVYRRYKSDFEKKDKDLFARIKAFRVDPSANSFSNPVPDYYGEKINSVQGYRRWLKDQRAYNRKKRTFV